MKKIMLTLASALFIGIMAANAQVQDTTKRQGSQGSTGTTGTGSSGTTGVQGTTGQGSQGSQGSESNQAVGQKKDMVRVQANEVPASLRKTLEDPMYAGWENSTIYRNKNSNEYTVEILNGTTTRTYRFDKNGKPVIDDKDENK